MRGKLNQQVLAGRETSPFFVFPPPDKGGHFSSGRVCLTVLFNLMPPNMALYCILQLIYFVHSTDMVSIWLWPCPGFCKPRGKRFGTHKGRRGMRKACPCSFSGKERPHPHCLGVFLVMSRLQRCQMPTSFLCRLLSSEGQGCFSECHRQVGLLMSHVDREAVVRWLSPTSCF